MNQEQVEAERLAYSVLATAAGFERVIARALRGTGLSVAHWLILVHLRDHQAATMTALGQASHVPPATLTRMVDKLVDHNLVYRALDGMDRRRVVARLTDRGAVLLVEHVDDVRQALAEELAELKGWEVQALRAMLSRTS